MQNTNSKCFFSRSIFGWLQRLAEGCADGQDSAGGSDEWFSARRDFDSHTDRAVTMVELLDEFLQFLIGQTNGTYDVGILQNDSGKGFSAWAGGHKSFLFALARGRRCQRLLQHVRARCQRKGKYRDKYLPTLAALATKQKSF